MRGRGEIRRGREENGVLGREERGERKVIREIEREQEGDTKEKGGCWGGRGGEWSGWAVGSGGCAGWALCLAQAGLLGDLLKRHYGIIPFEILTRGFKKFGVL